MVTDFGAGVELWLSSFQTPLTITGLSLSLEKWRSNFCVRVYFFAGCVLKSITSSLASLKSTSADQENDRFRNIFPSISFKV